MRYSNLSRSQTYDMSNAPLYPARPVCGWFPDSSGVLVQVYAERVQCIDPHSILATFQLCTSFPNTEGFQEQRQSQQPQHNFDDWLREIDLERLQWMKTVPRPPQQPLPQHPQHPYLQAVLNGN